MVMAFPGHPRLQFWLWGVKCLLFFSSFMMFISFFFYLTIIFMRKRELSSGCLCSVSFPRRELVWTLFCDCGISGSSSLTISVMGSEMFVICTSFTMLISDFFTIKLSSLCGRGSWLLNISYVLAVMHLSMFCVFSLLGLGLDFNLRLWHFLVILTSCYSCCTGINGPPRRNKTCLPGFQQDQTQISLLSYRD